MQRYIVGNIPDTNSTIGMLLEGEEDAVLARIMQLMKTGPAICWSITTDSPFSNR